MAKRITVQVAGSAQDLSDRGPDHSMDCDTIREAKARAEHYLSAEYARAAGKSEPFGYARIVVNGEVLYDFGR